MVPRQALAGRALEQRAILQGRSLFLLPTRRGLAISHMVRVLAVKTLAQRRADVYKQDNSGRGCLQLAQGAQGDNQPFMQLAEGDGQMAISHVPGPPDDQRERSEGL